MATKYELITTGNGASVKNGETLTQVYNQDGTIATGATVAASLATGAVTLAKLAAGITPSHVAKFSGTVTWSGSGASLAQTLTGVAATDIIQATITTKPTQAAYLAAVAPTTNTITYTLSAANTSNDAVIAYTVFRAAA